MNKNYLPSGNERAWFSEANGKLIRIHWEATSLHLPSSARITRIE